MKLNNIEKIHNGKYLSYYNLKYINKLGNDKIYEIVSRNHNLTIDNLGTTVSGVTIIIKHKSNNKYLLLKEFRMALNNCVYNFVAGLIDEGETVEECVKREVYEETGINNIEIVHILPPAVTSVGCTDEKIYTVFVEVDGVCNLRGDSNQNELMYPAFYSKEEIRNLLETELFSTKTQCMCYLLCK